MHHHGYNTQLQKAWPPVAAALQLEPGQTICLAALSPSRLLISREGEPHFSAAASQEPPDLWPLRLHLTAASFRKGWLIISAAAGRTMCRGDDLRMPAVIVLSADLIAGRLRRISHSTTALCCRAPVGSSLSSAEHWNCDIR